MGLRDQAGRPGAVWARDDQGLRGVAWLCGERGSRGLKKLKSAGLNGARGVRRGQSQRCPLVSDLGKRVLWGPR